MSDFTDAMDDGIANNIPEAGITVSIDGGGTFLAIPENFQRGNTYTDQGLREVAGCNLTFARSAWIPVEGKRLTVDGIAFVVASVGYDNPATYVVTCTEGNL